MEFLVQGGKGSNEVIYLLSDFILDTYPVTTNPDETELNLYADNHRGQKREQLRAEVLVG